MDGKLLVANGFGPAGVFVATFEWTLVAPKAPKLLQVARLLLVHPLVMWDVLQELASAKGRTLGMVTTQNDGTLTRTRKRTCGT